MAFVALASTALAACGGGNDQSVLERELQVLLSGDVKPAVITRDVECPDNEDIPVNTAFLCDTMVEQQYFEAEVTFVDAQRHYEVIRRHAVLNVLETEVELAAQVGQELGFGVQANCGSNEYLVASIGGPFRCALSRVSQEQSQDVNVTAIDTAGTIEWELVWPG